MEKKRALNNAWLCGSAATLSLMSLREDVIGQAGCIEEIQNYWVSGRISIPVMIVVLVISIIVMVYLERKDAPTTC